MLAIKNPSIDVLDDVNKITDIETQIGDTDISSIGDGSITGAINNLNTLVNKNTTDISTNTTTTAELNNALKDKANVIHTHTKSEVGLEKVDNTADSEKSVKYATSAGTASTANAVAWGNVTGKPSTYTPTTHTHNYAGSSSAGGSATSAIKLDSSAGDSNTPVYFSNGKPVACTSLDLNTSGSSASCTGNAATATNASQLGGATLNTLCKNIMQMKTINFSGSVAKVSNTTCSGTAPAISGYKPYAIIRLNCNNPLAVPFNWDINQDTRAWSVKFANHSNYDSGNFSGYIVVLYFRES